MIKVSPVDKNIPKDHGIAVDAFIGLHIPETKAADKAWYVYGTDGETCKVLGFAACNIGNRIADVPVYHVIEGTNRQEKWESLKAHEMLFDRVCGFVADMVGSGTEVFFHIAPEAQAHWKDFEVKVKGRNAHRFVMEV